MIIFDPPLRGYRDGESLVLCCTECGHVWRALTFSRADAYASRERHQVITHGDSPSDARRARELAEQRADPSR